MFPKEKPRCTIGCPIIPSRKVLDGILYVLRTKGYQWKMILKEFGSGSTCHRRRFQQWIQADIFKKIWIKVLEEHIITK
jgi:transposase